MNNKLIIFTLLNIIILIILCIICRYMYITHNTSTITIINDAILPITVSIPKNETYNNKDIKY